MNESVNINLDLSEPINNVIDKTGNQIDYILKPLFSIIDYVDNVSLYKVKKETISKKYSLSDFENEMKYKVSMIPDEKLMNPKLSIMGPIAEKIKYSMNEEYIRDMFINILVSHMNSDYSNNVHPSFIDTVSQLSKDDAIFLTEIKKIVDYNFGTDFCLLEMIEIIDKGYRVLGKYIINNKDGVINCIELSQMIIDNLSRLGLITISTTIAISDSKLYKDGFELLSKKYKKNIDGKLSYHSQLFLVSEYGRNFLNICIQ